MMKPVIGFAGMTHLGINSAAAALGHGFETVCFDPDRTVIARLKAGSYLQSATGIPAAEAERRAAALPLTSRARSACRR